MKTIVLAGTVLALGLALAGCSAGNEPGNNQPGSNQPGNNDTGITNHPVTPSSLALDLTGRVYMMRQDVSPPTLSPFPATLTRTVSFYGGGGGAITGGLLNFGITTPNPTLWNSPILGNAIEDSRIFGERGRHTFSVPGVRYTRLRLDTRAPGQQDYSGNVDLIGLHTSTSGNSIAGEFIERIHIFVDRDVTVSLARDETWTETGEQNGMSYSRIFTDRAFTLNLRRGWNTVYAREVLIGTFTGTIDNLTSITYTFITTRSTSNPGQQLRWIYLKNGTVTPKP